MHVVATSQPSIYGGILTNHTILNEETNVQVPGQNQTGEEGSSRLLNEVVDYDGHTIDLNNSPKSG